MLKRILFAVAPIAMVFGSVSANDDLLNSLASLQSNLVVATDNVSETAPVESDNLGQADVDALLGDDDQDSDAVAACFRRIGYGYGHSHSYRSYGYNYGHGYGYGYNHYRPSYNYHCYQPVSYSYYHPVTYHVPVYTSYWACY